MLFGEQQRLVVLYYRSPMVEALALAVLQEKIMEWAKMQKLKDTNLLVDEE